MKSIRMRKINFLTTNFKKQNLSLDRRLCLPIPENLFDSAEKFLDELKFAILFATIEKQESNLLK